MGFKEWLEVAGYVGSALVLVSFLMTSVVKLRIVNMAGSLISCVYALIIGSYPLAIMNAALVLINLYFLWKIGRTKTSYVFVDCEPGDPVLSNYLVKYRADIEKCFPGIDLGREQNFAALLLSEDEPAGFVLGLRNEEKLDLVLDYSLPKYRDYSLGKFLRESLPAKGITELRYSGPTENHMKYLEKMHFERMEDGSFVSRLS